MSLSITPENKNTLAITNDVRMTSPTWADRTNTWDDAVDTWSNPGLLLTDDTKNTITLTGEAKH